MTDTFLTVKQAALQTGKSPSSIRRLIYPILEADHHPDRHHIQPSVEETLQLRMKGENFPWRISEELLRREVPIGNAPEKGSADAQSRSSSGEGYAELFGMLRRELEIKNDQISKQLEVINGLSQRLREGNILIGSLQQRLSLSDGLEVDDTSSSKANSAARKPEKGSRSNTKTPKPAANIFSRLLRKKLW